MATVAESVTKDGSAFQTRASATGKARSPIVILRVGGTTSADVDAERIWLSFQYLPSDWLMKPNHGVEIVSIKPRPKSVYDLLALVYCFTLL